MSDFVLIRYAMYADGELVETNDPEIKADAKDKPLLIKIGDKIFPAEVEEKLKESDSVEVELPPEKSPFGERDRSLMKAFRTKDITKLIGRRPKIGDKINLGGSIGTVVYVDRNQTIVDFNHPLAGKKIKYTVKVIQRLSERSDIIKRLIYTICDEIKPEEIEISVEENNAVVTLPKGWIKCPNVDLAAGKKAFDRGLLESIERKKPLKAERLKSS